MAQTMAAAAASASVRFIGMQKLLQITRAAVSISTPAAASFCPEIPTAVPRVLRLTVRNVIRRRRNFARNPIGLYKGGRQSRQSPRCLESRRNCQPESLARLVELVARPVGLRRLAVGEIAGSALREHIARNQTCSAASLVIRAGHLVAERCFK